METEIPALLRAREAIRPERFTFHSSRMRMQKVVKEELAAMDAQSLRCAAELADARMDVMGYACLVAIMATGLGYHRESETKLTEASTEVGGPCPIVTSAGALIDGIRLLGARKISIITPYMRPLTDLVVAYIRNEGIVVQDSIALEIPDNLEVGARDPMALLKDVERLDVTGVDLVVASACVQMPSLPALEPLQDRLGLPVTSAAACTVRKMLDSLGLEPVAPTGAAVLGKAVRVAA
ncbi:Asp/Glu racemase [Brevundimonas sp. NIBR10]|uniref:maleate cis-trans isomerase family protein n=1 Tax=Brevundimonas sp. NIBR10 TaxID=3015997 RepID=UPI0022F1CA66|nr:Asp/Glu racemase [Brevundimonas sp. NIBR10]